MWDQFLLLLVIPRVQNIPELVLYTIPTPYFLLVPVSGPLCIVASSALASEKAGPRLWEGHRKPRPGSQCMTSSCTFWAT